MPHIASSLTPFAFAPGVLNTTMPAFAHLSSGILLTPAPALAIASSDSGSSASCSDAERTSTASASASVSVLTYSDVRSDVPTDDIGLQ